MASKHTMKAELEVKVRPAGLVDDETVYPTVEITFSFSPGASDSYDAARGGPGGWDDPGYSAEVEFISSKLLDGDGTLPTQGQTNEWAEEWLASDTGYQAACRYAEEDRSERGAA